MLTIGEFSRICFVTKKTLRHYDELGLLRPEYTGDNGYRYYTVGQLRSMLLIKRLKGYGFSLPEISAVLAAPDDTLLIRGLEEKRVYMESRLQEGARLLRQMGEDAEKLKRRMDIMEQNIVVKQVEREPQNVYGVRGRIDVKDFSELFGRLFREIEEKGLQPVGPPMAFYFDEEFDQGGSDIEVAVPVAEGTPGAHVVPGEPHCYTTLVGPYNPQAFTAAYAALMQWVEEHGRRIAYAPFDQYVRGGEDCLPEEYVTEIYFPLA